MTTNIHHSNTFVLGICGGTASGKSTLVRRIKELLLPMNVSLIDQDSYYLDLSYLSPLERERINFDHPNAIDLDNFVADIKRLKSGLTIEKPIYDFSTHTREKQTMTVHSSAVTIVEGLHILFVPEIREQLNLRAYLELELDIRFIRRLLRDINERGRTVHSVVEQYLESVRPMELQFVHSSKRWADMIITHGEIDSRIQSLCDLIQKSIPAVSDKESKWKGF